MKKFLIGIILLLCGAASMYLYFSSQGFFVQKNTNIALTQDQKKSSIQPVTDVTSTAQTSDDQTSSVSGISDSEKIASVQITNLVENQEITSPVVIEGTADGSWFNDEKFPVSLVDEQGNLLGSTKAQAKGDVTEDGPTPFIATIDFTPPASATGYLLFSKTNPIDFKKGFDGVKFSIHFSQKPVERLSGGCKITGCSGQICAEAEMVTDCSYKEEYVCYQKATCERQTDGKCGWTQTKELTECIDQFTQ